jgi:hypothetical protein
MRLLSVTVLACALAPQLACSDDPAPPTLQLAVAGVSGDCQSPGQAESLATLGAGSLRLTLVQRTTVGAPAQLLCDRVLRSSGEGTSDLAYERDEEGRLDLHVEAFSSDSPPRLLARGVLQGLNNRPRLGPLSLLLTPVGGFACAPGLDAPRAFHTATPLPDGRVLLVGGLTHQAPAGASGDGLWLEPTAALFDPRSGNFISLGAVAGAARASHHTVLIGGPVQGPYDVLLVGGLRAKEGAPPAPVARLGGADDALPIVPTTAAEPAPTTVLRVYPYTDPPRVVVRPAPPALAARIYGAMAQLENGNTFLLGGLDDYSGGRLATVDTVEQLPAGSTEHRGPFALTHARVAAAATQLSATQVLVFGGNFDSPPGQRDTEAIELLDLGSGVTAQLATFEVGSRERLRSLAHASLSSLGGGEVLLVGGLELEPGQARTPRADFPVQRITAVAGDLRVSNVASALFVPVAYHDASTLPDGEVLVTGGLAAPLTCPGGRACNKSYIYQAQGDLLTSAENLRAGRFGHRATPLPGGALLLSGGLTLTNNVTQALAGAELYQGTAGDDAFSRAPATSSGIGCAN